LKYTKKVHAFVQKKDQIIGDQEVKKSSARAQVVNGHIVASVRRNRKLDYNGQVYNLEVAEDNSYVLQSAAHNCNRDHWMDAWIQRSPFRNMYKWMWMPTVDSCPQDEDWIRTYESCDYVMAYTDFGIDTLSKNSPVLGKRRSKLHKLPLRTPIDTKTFRPMDNKEELKKEWLQVKSNVPVIFGNQIFNDRIEDRKIILTTQRNQARKLLPDLIDAFATMKVKYKGIKKIDDALLWLHTSYPDNAQSYNYPKHIKRISEGYYGVKIHYPDLYKYVLNTFICGRCGHVFADYAINLVDKSPDMTAGNPRIHVRCQKCMQPTAACPNVAGGVDRDVLAQIYNCADVYCQLSIAEGEGIPPIESKSCGVCVLALDYSALSEKVKVPDYQHIDKDNYTVHKGGMPVKVDRWYYEPETSQRRALPDIEDAANKMYELITNDNLREKMAQEARECVIENYGAEEMAARWEFIFDNIEPKLREETWEKEPEVREPGHDAPPPNQSPEEFIDWCYNYVLKVDVDPQGKAFWLQTIATGQNNYETIYRYFHEKAMADYNNTRALREAQTRFKGGEVKPDDENEDKVRSIVMR
jgi:glycosyltransferase involved in cell wall biosynthesis